jgi:hypothetical protein
MEAVGLFGIVWSVGCRGVIVMALVVVAIGRSGRPRPLPESFDGLLKALTNAVERETD